MIIYRIFMMQMALLFAGIATAQECPLGKFKLDGKCWKIGKQCSDYNKSNEKVCNNNKDTLKCDWDPGKKICFAEIAKQCRPGEFKDGNTCYRVAKQCSAYNKTNPRVCNNNHDKLKCDWNPANKVCFAEGSQNESGTGALDPQKAADLILSAKESGEVLSMLGKPQFTAEALESPKVDFNQSLNTVQLAMPEAPSEQIALKRSFLPSASLVGTMPSSGNYVERYWQTPSNRYGQGKVGFSYSTFTSRQQNVVHSGTATGYMEVELLSYRSRVLEARLLGSYDLGPDPSRYGQPDYDASFPPYYSYFYNLDVLGVRVASSAGAGDSSGPLLPSVNKSFAAPAPINREFFRSPSWVFPVAGVPIFVSTAVSGSLGIEDIKLSRNSSTASATFSMVPYIAVVSSANASPIPAEVTKWLSQLGGVINTALLSLQVNLTVLKAKVPVWAVVGMENPATKPNEAFMCHGANFKELAALDGNIKGHAEATILTKVVQTVVSKVCGALFGCFGQQDKIEKIVDKYTKFVWDHKFFEWNGRSWEIGNNGTLDYDCARYSF